MKSIFRSLFVIALFTGVTCGGSKGLKIDGIKATKTRPNPYRMIVTKPDQTLSTYDVAFSGQNRKSWKMQTLDPHVVFFFVNATGVYDYADCPAVLLSNQYTSNAKHSETDIREFIVGQTMLRKNCPCPESEDADGNACGENSVYSKGGSDLACSGTDVTDEMIDEYKKTIPYLGSKYQKYDLVVTGDDPEMAHGNKKAEAVAVLLKGDAVEELATNINAVKVCDTRFNFSEFDREVVKWFAAKYRERTPTEETVPEPEPTPEEGVEGGEVAPETK